MMIPPLEMLLGFSQATERRTSKARVGSNKKHHMKRKRKTIRVKRKGRLVRIK